MGPLQLWGKHHCTQLHKVERVPSYLHAPVNRPCPLDPHRPGDACSDSTHPGAGKASLCGAHPGTSCSAWAMGPHLGGSGWARTTSC